MALVTQLLLTSLFQGADGRCCYEYDHTLLVPVIAAVGDVDRDGAADLLIADAGNNSGTNPPPATHLGRAWVVSGVTGAILRTLVGDEPGDGFGVVACGLGDVDDDGVPDWVVGAMGSKARRYGSAVVFSGATGRRKFEVASPYADDLFGLSLADVGDFDGDGARDFAVGAAHPSGTSLPSGRVRFFSGRDGRPLGEVASLGDRTRRHIERLGELDGDGRDEIVVSQTSAWSQGGARILSGRGDWRGAAPDALDEALSRARGVLLVANSSCTPEQQLWMIRGSSIERFSSSDGASLPTLDFEDWDFDERAMRATQISSWANLGDVNGDGVEDVVIGFADYGVGEGRIRVLSGVDGRMLYLRGAMGALWHFGASVVALGDLDGDAMGDFAVGNDNTRSHETGEVRVFSGRTGQMRWRIHGSLGSLVVWM
ncbi:MAG: integrin alpha [Planctomycetes bacterium]|nr:integrin alpha [Planctomycetota bacterium]